MARPMKGRTEALLWTPFAVVSFFTFLVNLSLKWIYWYPSRPVLTVLCVASFVAAVPIVLRKRRPLTFLIVIIGLVIGQWWLLLELIVIACWKIMGFAP
jgi:hypothetical protein